MKSVTNHEPCPHAKILTGEERAARKLGHGKRWALCLHPDKPLSGRSVVCPCQGCGPKCDGYPKEPVEKAEENTRGV